VLSSIILTFISAAIENVNMVGAIIDNANTISASIDNADIISAIIDTVKIIGASIDNVDSRQVSNLVVFANSGYDNDDMQLRGSRRLTCGDDTMFCYFYTHTEVSINYYAAYAVYDSMTVD